jgi:tetratricopeptide (TPR) repeat protein
VPNPENEPTPAETAPVAPSDSPAPPDSEVPPPESSGPPPEETEDDFDEYEPLTPELVEEEAIRGDFVLKWAVVLLAVLLGSTRITDTATLLHLKTGQYLASHGVLPPSTDVFSYTATDRPWVNLAWGFDLVAAAVYAVGGFVGLSIVKALVAGVTFGVIVSISRPGLPTWWSSICAAAALLACHNRLAMQPYLVTLLGCALVLWLLDGWVREPDRVKRLWLLVPILFVWSNLDSHAYVGTVLVLLYALGDTVGSWLLNTTPLEPERRTKLWTVAAAGLAVTLIHPFGWQSLFSPLLVYGTDYPALRDYIQGTWLGQSQVPGGAALLYFPMWVPRFWEQLGVDSIAALLTILAAVVVMALNFKRLEMSHVFVCAGFLAFAALCIHELAAAALVCSVLAALNGQAWYAATFRQTYSVATGELLFSRGGRALTVLAFSAVAFLGGTGRLRDVNAASTGFGLDHNLAVWIDDLERQLADSYDTRPFNHLLSQGDVLIWIGQQVFADSRVSVYHDPDDDQNLLARHQRTRDALRQEVDTLNNRLLGRSRREEWVPVFNKYEITHIVPRLSSSPADYSTLFQMLQSQGVVDSLVPGQEWQLTSVGATAAVLYRTDLEKQDYRDYVLKHQADFRDQAYKQTAEPIGPRTAWVRSPSFYQKYFWSKKREVPPEIQRAQHLVQLAAGALPVRYEGSRAAMAYLAIRLAQEGLNREPGNPEGYIALGQSYELLSQWETLVGRNPPRTQFSGMRYLQAVAAYNQALVAEPDSPIAHGALFRLYEGAQRTDLMLRHAEALDRRLENDPQADSENVLKLVQIVEELRTSVENVETALDGFAGQGADPLQLAQGAYQRGCPLSALRRLDEAPEALAGNMGAEQFRIMLLLETGRVEDAYEAAERWSGPARSAGRPGWHDIVALCQLPNAGYEQAVELWTEQARDTDRQLLTQLLGTLSPTQGNTHSPLAWPIGATAGALDYFTQRPASLSQFNLNAGLALLEEGELARARKLLEETLEQTPEAPQRLLIAYYLTELTGEPVDALPPSAFIPILFADDEETKPAGPAK